MIWSAVRHQALDMFSWQHFFLKSTPGHPLMQAKLYIKKVTAFPPESFCCCLEKSAMGNWVFFQNLGTDPLLEQDPRTAQVRDKIQSLFLVSYGQEASWSLSSCPLLFVFSISFSCCLPSKESAAFHHNYQMEIFSLQGHGQRKGPALRYTVVLIGSESSMFRMIPKDELEIQDQGSPQMATRRFLAHQKNN